MSINHRKAFELIEKASSGMIRDWERVELEQHLEECQQCRANASLFQELGEAAWPDFPGSQLSNQQVVADLQQRIPSRRHKHTLFRFAQEAAWVGLAILFVLGLNWTFANLIPADRLPGVVPGVVEPGLFSPQPGSGNEGEASQLPGLLDDPSFTSMMIMFGFISLVGVTFGFWSHRKWAKWGWLGFMLMGLLMLIILHSERVLNPNAVPKFFISLPFDSWIFTLMVILSALIIHLVKNPEVRKRQLLYFLIPYSWMLCIILTMPSFMSEFINAPSNFMRGPTPDFSSLWLFLIGGVLLASFWLAWELPGKWRWLLYLFLFFMFSSAPLMLAMNYLPQNTTSFMGYFPTILGYISAISYIFFWSFSAIITARLIQSILSREKKLGFWQLLIIMVAILATSIVVFSMLWEQTISSITSYDPGFWGYTFLFMVSTGSALAVIGISWEMGGWCKILALSFMIVFVIGSILAVVIPHQYAEVLHVRRAETVSQAIVRYYAANNHYPEELDDLFPRYLLWIPQPVTPFPNGWCYEAGEGYYRFGYKDEWIGSSPPFSVVEYARNGMVPEENWRCQLDWSPFTR
jgi:hypothetical protein